MNFDLANWHAIEVLWTLFAGAGLGVGIFNLRRSYQEKDVSDVGSPERVYAIGSIIRDWGRVIAQVFGTGLGLFSGFFNDREPMLIGSLIFFVYIGMYTLGSFADAIVRWVLTREGPRNFGKPETQDQKEDRMFGEERRALEAEHIEQEAQDG